MKLTLRQLQDDLSGLLDQATKSGDPVLVQREGKEDVVIVSARQWRRLSVGRRLDAKGPGFRLPPEKQKRAETLLAAQEGGRMSAAQRRELDRLLAEADDVMVRRARALDELE